MYSRGILFIGLLANTCLGSPLVEVESNELTLADDARSIEQKIMDTDIERSGTIDVNTFLSMNIIKIEMEACENIWSGRKCKKVKKGGKCTYKNKWNKCLKTCGCSCGSCYGADTPIDSKCCNTCDDVKKAYKEKGWTFQPELIQQCEAECPPPVSGGNHSNYHQILGRCYYFEETPMDFNGAMVNCETRFGGAGGRLFEPRSSIVNDAVAKKGQTIANNLEGSQWIGIRTDPAPAKRHFHYLSGGNFTAIPYGQWYPGEPNNVDGIENCIQMYTNVTHYGQWNDIDCYRYFQSICEEGNEVIWTN